MTFGHRRRKCIEILKGEPNIQTRKHAITTKFMMSLPPTSKLLLCCFCTFLGGFWSLVWVISYLFPLSGVIYWSWPRSQSFYLFIQKSFLLPYHKLQQGEIACIYLNNTTWWCFWFNRLRMIFTIPDFLKLCVFIKVSLDMREAWNIRTSLDTWNIKNFF